MCPSYSERHCYFNKVCKGEEFQIIGEGTSYSSITADQQIRIRYLHGHHSWISCGSNKNCRKSTCPGTTAQASNFANSRYSGEIFRIIICLGKN